jgi:uncharacterized protein DUF1490
MLALAGVMGDLIVEGARRVVASGAPRRVAVAAVAKGIVTIRWVEKATEEARLKGADLVAAAKASLGEEAAPPPEATVDGARAGGHQH